jgi:hypothetical protein
LVESTNKNLIKIIKRAVSENPKNWHNALYNALWTDRVTPKYSIGNSPFFLVYGRKSYPSSPCLAPFTTIISESSRGRMSLFRELNKCFT